MIPIFPAAQRKRMQCNESPPVELQLITNPVNCFPSIRTLTFISDSSNVSRVMTSQDYLQGAVHKSSPLRASALSIRIRMRSGASLSISLDQHGVVDHPAKHCENVVRRKDRIYFRPPYLDVELSISWGALRLFI